MENLEKTTIKQYFVCRTCSKKMEIMTIKSATTFDMFSLGADTKMFYCDNKECEKFGYLTIAGIKKEE